MYFYLLMVTDVEAEGVFALSFHSWSVKHDSNFQLILINFQLIFSNDGLWKMTFWKLEQWWISLAQLLVRLTRNDSCDILSPCHKN